MNAEVLLLDSGRNRVYPPRNPSGTRPQEGTRLEFQELKKLNGRVFKIEPWPITRTGRLTAATQHNQWRLILASQRLVVLTSVETPHRLTLDAALVEGVRTPDRLQLTGQLVVEGAKAKLVPLRTRRTGGA